MGSKKTADDLLSETMLQRLELERANGKPAGELTVRALAQLVSPGIGAAAITKAMGKRAFQKAVLVARSRNLDAPIALVADQEPFASSPTVLLYLLEKLRTASNQAFSPAQIRAKVPQKLKSSLRSALDAQLAQGRLPATVGWLTINRSPKLFLLADVRQGQPGAVPPPVAAPVVPVSEMSPGQFREKFDAAFDRLDREAGSHNFVSLLPLREQLAVARTVFDSGLQELRRAGLYGLSAAEGRQGLQPEEQNAGLMEDGTLLLYVSRKAGR